MGTPETDSAPIESSWNTIEDEDRVELGEDSDVFPVVTGRIPASSKSNWMTVGGVRVGMDTVRTDVGAMKVDSWPTVEARAGAARTMGNGLLGTEVVGRTICVDAGLTWVTRRSGSRVVGQTIGVQSSPGEAGFEAFRTLLPEDAANGVSSSDPMRIRARESTFKGRRDDSSFKLSMISLAGNSVVAKPCPRAQ